MVEAFNTAFKVWNFGKRNYRGARHLSEEPGDVYNLDLYNKERPTVEVGLFKLLKIIINCSVRNMIWKAKTFFDQFFETGDYCYVVQGPIFERILPVGQKEHSWKTDVH